MSTEPPLLDILRPHLERLLASREAPKTICPSEVARAVSSNENHDAGLSSWRELMPEIRKMVAAMRERAEVEVLQKGMPLNRTTVEAIELLLEQYWQPFFDPDNTVSLSRLRLHLNQNPHFTLQDRIDWLHRSIRELGVIIDEQEALLDRLRSEEPSNHVIARAVKLAAWQDLCDKLLDDMDNQRAYYRAIKLANQVLKLDPRSVPSKWRKSLPTRWAYIPIFERSLRMHLQLTGYSNSGNNVSCC
ncbi:hypothetical protein LSUE1_G008208 [Lachnellula suecica]|uniref:Uncharacterized protein n=1 Tax=Lachnellula suecica TaxID=602035 RepID=A0A8T9CB46_9HELO|nr:hypothetical protein LSUE1_G008208 [Lachnellula suecica]